MTVDLVLAFAIGLLAGALVTGLTMRRSPDGRLAMRPSKRQQRILASLPPDPALPSILDLVREEAEALGVLDAQGGDGVPLHVRLKVWKRDHDSDGCRTGTWCFEVRSGVKAAEADVDDVTLVCAEMPSS